MKIKKIIMYTSVAIAGYKIYKFISDEEKLNRIQNMSDNSQLVYNKYQEFNQKLNNVKILSEKLVVPSVRELTREINEFSYVVNFKIDSLQSKVNNLKSSIIEK